MEAQRRQHPKLTEAPKTKGDFGFLFSGRQPLMLYLPFVIFFSLSCLPTCFGVQREQLKPLLLMDDLFQNYSSLVTPRLDPSQSVDLNCFVNYISLLSLDNLDQEMTSQLLFSFSWTDELLRWNPEDYDNISSIYPAAGSIWRPGFSMLNQLSRTSSVPQTSDLASVLHTGLVSWAHTLIVETQCSLDMARFPFDEQVCVLHVFSTRPTKEIRIAQWSVSFSSDIQTNGEWEQVAISGELQPKNYGEVFDTLYMEVKFQRLSRYYLINVLGPMLLLSGLCNVVFLVSAESGDKLTVALTLLLSESVFLSYTSGLMPKTSDELPILTLYLLCLLVVNTVSILATLLVLKAFKYNNKPNCPVPPHFLIVIWNVFGPKPGPDNLSSCMRRRSNRAEGGDDLALKRPEMVAHSGNSFRALSEKLATLATLGWFSETEAKKCQSKIYPERGDNDKENSTSGYGTPAFTTGSNLHLKESGRSSRISLIPSYGASQTDSTVVDLVSEDIGSNFGELYSEEMHVNQTHGIDMQFKPKNQSNNLEACNADHQYMPWACAKNYRANTIFPDRLENSSNRIAWDLNPTTAKDADNNLKTLGKKGDCEKLEYRDLAREWLFISKALDRMFFILFNILIGCVTIYFFATVL